MTDNLCKHKTLYFGSGGYYIFCQHCHVRWVAIKNGISDTELDYTRSSNNLNQGDKRDSWEYPDEC